MSLDLYLISQDQPKKHRKGSGIFIREKGQVLEISTKEWNKRYPDRTPATFKGEKETNVVYSANITHNLTEMAGKAGLYSCLWIPELTGIKYAKDLEKKIQTRLPRLQEYPDYFKSFNPPSGWGDYDTLVSFTKELLAACLKYPESKVSVST